MSWPWNPGQRSFKVIETDTYRSATYDFLLTFHSNCGPISYRFRDRRRFQSKIAKKISPPVYFMPPLKGFPLELGIGARGQKSSNDRATRYHIISYHLHLLRRHSPNVQQRRTTQYIIIKKILIIIKILIQIKSSMKQESLEMFLECCLATTITNVNWQWVPGRWYHLIDWVWLLISVL